MLIQGVNKTNVDKLGKGQSQTQISSAFLVQKDFGLKKVLGPK